MLCAKSTTRMMGKFVLDSKITSIYSRYVHMWESFAGFSRLYVVYIIDLYCFLTFYTLKLLQGNLE